MRIEILHRYTKNILYQSANVESMRDVVAAAVKSQANLSGADLSRANLIGADLIGADLSRADLSRADLSRADLIGADLSGADLSQANLSGADLSRADLIGANLSQANLIGADLSRANLIGADLIRANLREANLIGANLIGADLSRADLSGANLSQANLSRANLSRAKGIPPLLTTPLHILRDQPGKIRAYKLVGKNAEGPYARNSGYVPIAYKIDGEYSEKADIDENRQCGAGINLGTLDWCLRAWRPSYRILIAEFEATDIAAIPLGSDGKFRVHRCKIVGEKSLSECGEGPWSDA